MITVWCDCKGITHCEVLPRYIALTVHLYCQRLHRTTTEVAGKGPNYVTIQFLHDPARTLIMRVTRQKLPDFGWGVLTSPRYRPGLAPKDYELIPTLSNALQGKACVDEDDLNCWSSNFFQSMPVQYYAEYIEALPADWQRVTVRDGNLLIS
ncbi:hypothetical protein Y032_0235g3204 [Ancylostoma ceylanicum]|uniref:Uncharacterized protein n=1 Tax=Ancylostoma ceylanicum TaxID=53326 RepID=A0A016SER3_9BILA|nr:hypothetical protein Y032_0235g3204 [Ancylostoma ceylanicum]